MDDTIDRIRLFRCLSEPYHIAFKTKSGSSVPHLQYERSAIGKEDNLSPAGSPLCGLLNVSVVKAADPALWRKNGRVFFAFRHSVGCRGPPAKFDMKIKLTGKDFYI